jgi:hypothetical protein
MKTLFTVILLFTSTVCWGSGFAQAKKIKIGEGYVVCVVTSPSTRAGVTCNWEAYNKRQEKDGVNKDIERYLKK